MAKAVAHGSELYQWNNISNGSLDSRITMPRGQIWQNHHFSVVSFQPVPITSEWEWPQQHHPDQATWSL
eukprot:2534034-Ditylum_brightwellii.AAC.1